MSGGAINVIVMRSHHFLPASIADGKSFVHFKCFQCISAFHREECSSLLFHCSCFVRLPFLGFHATMTSKSERQRTAPTSQRVRQRFPSVTGIKMDAASKRPKSCSKTRTSRIPNDSCVVSRRATNVAKEQHHAAINSRKY